MTDIDQDLLATMAIVMASPEFPWWSHNKRESPMLFALLHAHGIACEARSKLND